MSHRSTSLRLIAAKSLKSILRRKLPYLALLLAALVLMVVVSSIAFLQMAREAGEIDAAQTMQVQSIQSVFGIWTFATMIVGIGLGAGTISSEVKAGTIVPVLSKPVERWVYLVGRWIGNQIFLIAFMGLGFLICTIVMIAFGLSPNGLFWTALALSLVSILLTSTLATMIAMFLSPIVAGGLTFFLVVLQGLVTTLITQPWGWVRYSGLLAYYLLPSHPHDDVLGLALRSAMLNPEYGTYVMVLLENVGYSVSLLLVACAVFGVKEVHNR